MEFVTGAVIFAAHIAALAWIFASIVLALAFALLLGDLVYKHLQNDSSRGE